MNYPKPCLRVLMAFAIMSGSCLEAEGMAPLRVDLNAQARNDMETEHWTNWQASGAAASRSFDGVTVRLTADKRGGELRFEGSKALIVTGLTLGADAAVVAGGEPSVMTLELRGLPAGTHTFTSFHGSIGTKLEGAYSVLVDGVPLARVTPAAQAESNEDLASAFVRFEAKRGKAVTIQIVADGTDPVVLNGFAIDDTDPKHRALKPSPANYERHADGDRGRVRLSWTPADSAVTQNVFFASDRDAEEAVRRVAAAEKHSDSFWNSVPQGRAVEVPIEPNNSLLHYAWRVDSIDPHGNVTRGDIWRFRVRHLAFPTAEGYGRFAIGGRGGRVLHVTNLNDSGPGSLRAAVEATGPRTVVFDVSGLISLESKLVFGEENEFLTIAGQTAPGKGICIRNYTFGGIGSRDTIVRFIRLRMGDLAGETMDGMGLASGDHSIVDHCSISWSIDEAFSSRGAKNITFQRNLISEALNVAGHRKYGENKGHGYAGSISGNVGSFHHSLLAHNAGRNWSLAGAIDQANRHAGRLDIRNMVVYNWRNRTTDGGAREVNFVNNYYKPGPASEVMTYLNPQYENPSFGPQQYYVSGNVMEGVVGPEGPASGYEGMRVRGKQPWPVTVEQPFFESYVTTHSAEEAYENVLADVGCNVPMLDDHDKRVIQEVRTGTTTFVGSRSGLPGLPDSQTDVGGWEDYPVVHRPENWDTDRDGLPDQWEARKGLDPRDGKDGAEDPDGDGYTHLEDYLNWLAAGNTF
ncbi:T9SS C-terminal target domain-containing protein [Pelagicoccus sp. NFK12]|uniref:T9SS C-terminal target domain-containing protein n=1 Tax=Pelagicoccus enzymogenes TaxID=2773457 RepID=A0A927F643_9BACT|nr:T9SS C-terminal target domain-containing protein [Pelagicoccus enzymogenes]MBD5779123.1 T9SS C-terminal target domain-containing protein [Pelagicoccus enzymogenes]